MTNYMRLTETILLREWMSKESPVIIRKDIVIPPPDSEADVVGRECAVQVAESSVPRRYIGLGSCLSQEIHRNIMKNLWRKYGRKHDG